MAGNDNLIDILLIEDSPGDIELTLTAFEECKIRNEVTVVTDGEEAIDFLYRRGNFKAARRPDIIMLDLNLPKRNGQEVLTVIKNDASLKQIPVVVLTSSEAERDIVKTYNLHANCYIIKPVDAEKFLNVVKSIEDFWLNVVKLPKPSGEMRKAS
jgi:chemotaxis family two-component system response regulator Rcp1